MNAAPSQWLDDQNINTAASLAMQGQKSGLFELAETLGQVGHWWVSLPDYAVTWSAEVYQIHGVTRENYKPELATAIGFYHPDDRGTVETAVAAAISHGTPFKFSLRLIRADGELRYVKSRGLMIAGPGDLPAQVFGIFMDVTEECERENALRDENLKLEKIAYVDALTGLANRRQFDEALSREWLRAGRDQSPLSLVMIDIDRFKSFNDLYGHPDGDACLRDMAEAMATVLKRSGDLMARYGGEEFALILPAANAAGAEKLAQDVRGAIEAMGIPHAGNPGCGGVVTASLGVATADPHPDAPGGWADLLSTADEMLYEAKRTGRNRVVSAHSLTVAAALPEDEVERLAALAEYEKAGATERSEEFDRIAKLAATLTGSPIGLVSLVGEHEQYFAGNFGLPGVDKTGRDVSFCAHTIQGDAPLVVADATRDPRFENNDLVTGDLGLRFYAGAPIISQRTGHRLGALCVVDPSAHGATSPAQRALLADLASMVATLLEQMTDPDR